MSYMIGDTEVPVRVSGGMVDILIRAEKEADWITSAKLVGLMVDQEQDDGTFRDVPAPGVNLTPQPIPIKTKDAEFDADGEITKAAEYDKRHYVNVRLTGPALDALAQSGSFATWQDWVLDLAEKATEDTKKNKAEKAWKWDKIAVIEPTSIATEQNVWL